MREVVGPGREGPAGSDLLSAPESNATLFHKAIVLPEQEMLLHLRHGIERDADDNQQPCATEAERNVDPLRDDHGR